MNREAPIQLRAEGLATREIEGETVILDSRRSLYLAVNRTGTLLWRLLAEGCTREDLIQRLTDEYEGIDEDVATRDVDAFLDLLASHDLITQ